MLFGIAALGAIASLVGGVTNAISSSRTAKQQAEEAAKIEANNKRPIYTRPKESLTALNLAEQMAYSPNFAGRGYAEEQLGAGTANAIRGMNETGLGGAESAALLASLYSQQQEGAQGIAAQGTAQQNAGLLELLSQLQTQSAYSDQEFNVNKQMPYEQGAAAASALRGASMANKDVARRGITNSISSLGYGLMTSNMGGGDNKTTTGANDIIGQYGAANERRPDAQRGIGGLSDGGLGGETYSTGGSGMFGGLDTRGMNQSDILQLYQLLGILPSN